MIRSLATLPALALLAGCLNGKVAPGAGAPQAAAPEAAPQLRLPSTARPQGYKVDLRIVPTEETFSGSVEISLAVSRPLPLLWLNANDLQITRAEARAGERTVAAHAMPAVKNFVGIAFDEPLPAGAATLRLEYTGRINGQDNDGIFREKEGDDWYVFTQFEATDARRAFPCFDEPTYKVPWQLTLRVPQASKAFANTAMESEEDAGGGMRAVHFAPTRPLPSYLVAFAVGPLERLAAGKTPGGAPAGIIVLRGQAARATWAVESTPQILATLEEYFGIPYPYPKSDSIAVPLFGGAMENPGLVTYAQGLLLAPPEGESVQHRRAYGSVGAHELAHQWFGDLVTTGWWDDIWLNEAFATWMANKVLEKWQPDWHTAESRVNQNAGAMGADSIVTARRIRQPIESAGDIQSAFDGITYQKGSAVIGMFESYVGKESFQRGVQRHLREHADGVASADQFLASISAEAGEVGKNVTAAFSSFLDQPGLPLVSASLVCAQGKEPRLALAQQRYLPLGAGKPEGGAQKWQIPVCVRWSAGGEEGRTCTLLTEPSAEVALTGAKACPDWVLPNDGAAGYYRTLLPVPAFEKLLKARGVTVPERMQVAADLRALAGAGKAELAQVVRVLLPLGKDDSPFLVRTALNSVAGLRQSYVPEDLLPQYERLIRASFGDKARAAGFHSRPAEDDEARLLRPQLLRLVGDQGHDEPLGKEARKLAEAWLKDHAAVEPDLVQVVLDIAAVHGDRALFDQYNRSIHAEQSRPARNRLLDAISNFRDPAIAADARKLALDEKVDPREGVGVLFGGGDDVRSREDTYQFIRAHYDELARRLPRDLPQFFVFSGTALCEENRVQEVETFFKPRASRFEGGERTYAQAMERMNLCTTQRKLHGKAIAAMLREVK